MDDTQNVPVALLPRKPTSTALGSFERTFDRKVAQRGYFLPNSNRWVPSIANSFGTLHGPPEQGGTCPCTTDFCNGCYAGNSERQTGVRAKMQRNAARLKSAATYEEALELYEEMIQAYLQDFTRARIDPRHNIFREDWDGDILTPEQALAMAQVSRNHPDVWTLVYSRSFVDEHNFIPYLVGVPNLTVYISVDAGNVEAARLILAQYPSPLVWVAFCADDYRGCNELARQLGRKMPEPCPENNGKIPLMGPEDLTLPKEQWHGTNGVGACVRCRKCIDGAQDIAFARYRCYDASAKINRVGDVQRSLFRP